MAALESNVFTTALIYEGGGMRAGYTAGLANVLLENGIFFDNVYGLSAGASNTVNYLSRDTWRVKASFVDLVKDPQFGGLRSWLRGKGWFNARHIYQEMGKPDGFLPFDMTTFAANPATCTIESFDALSGQSIYWTKDDLTTLDDLMLRVRASSTLPLVMPSPLVDGRQCYDGGLGEGAGFVLPRAQRDGFERFLIARTRPKDYRKKPPEGKSDKLVDASMRKHPEVQHALKTRWQRYNKLCDQIEALEAEGAAYVFYAKDMAVESGEKDLAKLQANYDAGYAQAQAELPAIKEFLGL